MKDQAKRWAILWISLSAAPGLAANKCIEPGGRVVYQDAPCPATARGGDMTLNVNRSVTGQAQGPDPNTTTLPVTGRVLAPVPDSPPNRAASPPDPTNQ